MALERIHPDRTFKVLLIGDSSVGKTCLMLRFAADQFSEKLTPTIGVDFKMKTLRVRDKIVKLQLWDTAGQEKFRSITRSYYHNADAIILVYDRTEASTFQHVANWMKCIDDDAPTDVLRILVGNKSDLYNRIVISTKDGKDLADKYHVDFFETSARSDTGSTISDMFAFIAEKLVDLKQPKIDPQTIDINQSKRFYENIFNCC